MIIVLSIISIIFMVTCIYL
ncbi:hypothetical protein MTW78_12440 [Mammaliicoccus sciuri]|nr:hypothetical protein [Mammaliicoccus sciuri]MCJ0968888.1 hypothetical protein [Mammaliicoccus sciuri]